MVDVDDDGDGNGDALIRQVQEGFYTLRSKLAYKIWAFSGWSGSYHPSHILHETPLDQNSRWSVAATRGQPAYCIIRLDEPAVVTECIFGKYARAHPCNVSDFKVYALLLASPEQTEWDAADAYAAESGGADSAGEESKWVRILHDGLINDANPEAFNVRYYNASGQSFATRHLMIVPLATHQPNYHCAIWHFSMFGIKDKKFVQRGHLDAVQALTSSGSRSVQLEDPLLSELYHTLVIKGDWVATESLLERIAYNIDKISTPYAPNTLFGRGARDSPPNLHWNSTLKHSIERAYRPPWPALVPPDPPARRAQATAYDARNRVIYMHGGWDGIQDLADFWAYDVRAREWTMISPDTSQVLMSRVVPGEGIKPSFEPPIPGLPPSRLGPSPRRGHAMAFDDRSGMLYLYGRFYEPDPNVAARFAPPHSSGTNAGQSLERTAQFIDRLRSSAGTHQSPRNAHNLLMMESADDADDAGAEYRPDLWAFDTRSRRWVCMSTDVRAQGGPCLLYDHKMIVDPRRQQLYIFGGQEVKESSVLDRNDPMNFWSGMWCFDLVSNTWSRSRDDPWLFPRTQNALLLGPPPGSGDGWDYSSSEQQPNHLWIIGGFDSRYTNDISTWNPTTHTFTPVPVRADARFGAFEGRPHLSSHPCASFDHEGTLWVWTSPSQRETPDLLENVPFGPAVRNELWRLDNTTLTWFRIWASDSVSSVSDGSVVPNPNETTAERASKRRGLNPTFGGLLRCHDWHPARPSHHEILTDVYPSGLFFDTYPPSWFFHGQADPSSHTRQHKEDEQPATFPTPKVGTEGLDGDELDELGLDLGLRSCDDWSTTPSPCGLSSSGSKTAGCMPIRIAPHFFCVSGGSGMPEMVFVGGVDPLPSNPHHTSQTASAWGDTWHLELRFPHWHDHLQRAHVLVRQQQFAEMLFDAGASVALGFLQSSLAEVLDYSSEHDTRLLRSLTSQLLDPPPTPSTSDSSRSQGRFTSKGDSCNSNGHWDDRLVTRQDRTMDDGVGSHVSRSPSSTSPRTATSDESWRARQLKATEPRQELVHSITH